MMKDTRIFALYKGDQYIMDGTCEQIAKARNCSVRGIKFLLTDIYKKGLKTGRETGNGQAKAVCLLYILVKAHGVMDGEKKINSEGDCMTNGERIRNMTNEDLAEWIAGIVGECELCPTYGCKLESGGCNITEDLKMWEVCWAIIADWLEAEADE